MKMKKMILNALLDLGYYTVGSIVYGFSVVFFMAPNHMSGGGLKGLGIIANYLFGFPIGTTTLVLNIPLLVLGFFFLGKGFVLKTTVATVMSSAAIDLLDYLLHTFNGVYHGDSLLAALFGGALMGAGLALIYIRGSTTGGTDIAAKLLGLKLPHISMGKLVFASDLVVVVASMIVFRSIETGLYSTIIIFVGSKVIDTILYGVASGKLLYIVTAQPELVSGHIMQKYNRGVTVLPARGAYSGQDRTMLMTALRKYEASRVMADIKRLEPSAFMMIAEATDIVGEGFERQGQ